MDSSIGRLDAAWALVGHGDFAIGEKAAAPTASVFKNCRRCIAISFDPGRQFDLLRCRPAIGQAGLVKAAWIEAARRRRGRLDLKG